MDQVEYDEYKGKALICLPTGNGNFPFKFGKAKAKAIVEYYEEIKAFAEEEE